MDQVNEGTTAYLTITFKNKAGANEQPASATWKVIELMSGTVLQEETALTPGAVVEIVIPPTVNRLINSGHPFEVHRVIIKGVYNVSDQVTGWYDFEVSNLNRRDLK